MYMQYDQRLNYPRSLIIVFIFHILDSTIHPVPLNRFFSRRGPNTKARFKRLIYVLLCYDYSSRLFV